MASDWNHGWASVPGFEEVDATAKAAPPDDADGRSSAGRLTLPRPADGAAPLPAPHPVLLPADLVTEPAPSPSLPRGAAATPEGPSVRTVVWVTIALSVVVGLAIAATTTRSSGPLPPSHPVPSGPAHPTEIAKTSPAPKVEPTAAPVTRMVTVVSTPPGALVEVNGVPFGKATVVRAAPEGVEELEVTLKLFGYETWQAQVRPNGLGHYSVNVRLRPKR